MRIDTEDINKSSTLVLIAYWSAHRRGGGPATAGDLASHFLNTISSLASFSITYLVLGLLDRLCVIFGDAITAKGHLDKNALNSPLTKSLCSDSMTPQ